MQHQRFGVILVRSRTKRRAVPCHPHQARRWRREEVRGCNKKVTQSKVNSKYYAKTQGLSSPALHGGITANDNSRWYGDDNVARCNVIAGDAAITTTLNGVKAHATATFEKCHRIWAEMET